MLGGNPLDRVEALAAALRPLPSRPPQEFVSSQVHFSEMPFQLESRILPGEDGPLSEIEVVIPYSSLAFDRFGTQYRARVDLEVFVRDVRKIVVSHRSHQLESTVSKSELARSRWQGIRAISEVFSLAAGRYLFEVWIRDVQGGAAAFERLLVVVPNEVKPGKGTQ